MNWFRLYFLDAARHIVARDEFKAEDDQHAITIAGVLYDACSDHCSGFELWRGAHRLAPEGNGGPARPSRGIMEITLQMQNTVLEREEMLQKSEWLIARSTRLQARIDELRNGGSRCDRPSDR